MAQGAAEAVQFPDDQGVTGAQLVQDLGEDRAVGAGAAGGLNKHPVAAGTFESVDLELRVLVGGGDPGIAEQMQPLLLASGVILVGWPRSRWDGFAATRTPSRPATGTATGHTGRGGLAADPAAAGPGAHRLPPWAFAASRQAVQPPPASQASRPDR